MFYIESAISIICYILYAYMLYIESVISSMYTMLYKDPVITSLHLCYTQTLLYLVCIYVISRVYLCYISRIYYSWCLSM